MKNLNLYIKVIILSLLLIFQGCSEENVADVLKDIDDPYFEIDKLRAQIRQLENNGKEADKLRDQIRQLENNGKEADKLRAQIRQLENNGKEADKLRDQIRQLENNGKEADKLRAQIRQLENKLEGEENKTIREKERMTYIRHYATEKNKLLQIRIEKLLIKFEISSFINKADIDKYDINDDIEGYKRIHNTIFQNFKFHHYHIDINKCFEPLVRRSDFLDTDMLEDRYDSRRMLRKQEEKLDIFKKYSLLKFLDDIIIKKDTTFILLSDIEKEFEKQKEILDEIKPKLNTYLFSFIKFCNQKSVTGKYKDYVYMPSKEYSTNRQRRSYEYNVKIYDEELYSKVLKEFE